MTAKKPVNLDAMAKEFAAAILRIQEKNNVSDEQLQLALGYVAGKLKHEKILTSLDLIDKASEESRAHFDERCHCPASKGTTLRGN